MAYRKVSSMRGSDTHVGSKMADVERLELEKRLASHSAYFNSLIELIPVKYYLPIDEEEKANKFYKNRSRKAPKQTIKEASRKAKLARLDPNQHKTIQEIQKEAEGNASTGNQIDLNDEEKIESPNFSVERVESKSLEDLRSRLHARIEGLQRKRNAGSGRPDGLQQPRAKKSKKEVKDKNKQKLAASFKESKASRKNDSLPSQKILNESGDVVFSKFDFLEAKKEPRPGMKKKNYEKLLAKAEARKKKLESLRKEDLSKAKELMDKLSWSQAIEKAEGIKQHDDPKLLKKAMKKRDKAKTKSKKQWEERIGYQKKMAEEKQKQRRKNIKERIEAKKGKKSGKGKKKHRPGF